MLEQNDKWNEITHSSPDEQTKGNLDFSPGWVLDYYGLWLDLLDHSLCQDINVVLFEGLFGIGDELLGEHGEHIWKGLDEGDSDLLGEF